MIRIASRYWLVAAGIAGGALAFAAHAQTPPDKNSYAVVSMIGDDLSIVTYRPAVGSNLDQNEVEHLPLEAEQFDRIAVRSATAALKRALPGATARSLTTAVHLEPQSGDELPNSDASVRAVVADVSAQLKDSGARYLLVVSKHRGDTRVKMSRGNMGAGKLRGLGFYLDNRYRTRASSNGHQGQGFIAPFVYVNVTLIDLGTGAVVRSESTTDAVGLSTARSETALVPWESMSADEKVDILNRRIRRAMATVVPHVVAPT